MAEEITLPAPVEGGGRWRRPRSRRRRRRASARKFRPAPPHGAKGKAHLVVAGRYGDGAEQYVGAQRGHRLAVELGEPPGMPQVVEHGPAAIRALHVEHHLGVLIGDDLDLTGPPGLRLARSLFDEHRRGEV